MAESVVASIIIVSYNSKEELEGCLDSIEKQGLKVEVFVVDNCSTDETPKVLKQLEKKYTFLKVIYNDENKGLAYANNQPIPYINGKYVLVLNPDIILNQNNLRGMVEYLDNNRKIGMIGPLCAFEDGTSHSSYHTDWGFFHIIFWRILPYGFMRYLYDFVLNRKTEKEVLFVSGACYLMPTALYKALNGYDPKYFLTVSDAADIGVRIKKLGYKCLFYPKIKITHFGGRSNNQVRYLTLITGLTGDLYFLKKHYGSFQETIARIIFIINSSIRGLLLLPLTIVNRPKYMEKVNMYLRTVKSLSKKNYLDDMSFIKKP